MALDFSQCRLQPFIHQQEDTQTLLEHPYYFIASEMRTGKSKIIVDTAHFLFQARQIDKVIVVAPAPVRDVWYDPTFGEIKKHAWETVPSIVTESHQRIRTWLWQPEIKQKRLEWYITNYEFLRQEERLTDILTVSGMKTMLVLDESSFIKNHSAQQTKSCKELRLHCGRVYLLNGTPIFHSPLDLFSQGNILHPRILQCKYITHFKAKYAICEPVLGYGGKAVEDRRGNAVQQIAGWTNLEDLQQKFAPYTVRRLQKDCLDLPPKLDAVNLTAELTPATWKVYKQMRDELVVWLLSGDVAVATTAATKVLRLPQITSGFLGGVEKSGVEEERPVDQDLLESLVFNESLRPDSVSVVQTVQMPEQQHVPQPVVPTQAISQEKLDILLWFIRKQIEEDEHLHLVSWCRFRPEVFRTVAAVQAEFPQFQTGTIIGAQKKTERLHALALLKPETSPTGPVFVCGIEGTGSYGLDMSASHTCVTMSSGYSPGRSSQTLDRVYGPGQRFPIAYYSILAVGPRGQKTIDHQIEIARRSGEDISKWVASKWVKMLTEE